MPSAIGRSADMGVTIRLPRQNPKHYTVQSKYDDMCMCIVH